MQPLWASMRSTYQRKEKERMSAAYLEVVWDIENIDTLNVRLTPVDTKPTGTRLAGAIKPARCPECQSVIYSRRHRLCGVCNQPLPDHLLFSVMEARRVEDLLRTERSRHRQWMEQRRYAD
jgi:hypothetical protein